MKKSQSIQLAKELTLESLWDSISDKRARGEKSSHKNSKAYKDTVKAGRKLDS